MSEVTELQYFNQVSRFQKRKAPPLQGKFRYFARYIYAMLRTVLGTYPVMHQRRLATSCFTTLAVTVALAIVWLSSSAYTAKSHEAERPHEEMMQDTTTRRQFKAKRFG